MGPRPGLVGRVAWGAPARRPTTHSDRESIRSAYRRACDPSNLDLDHPGGPQ